MSFKIIDVSTWQGIIDYNKFVSAGVQGVIPRAGFGKLASQIDNKYIINMTNATSAGLLIGNYWYSYANSLEDADLEAQVCYDIIKQFSNVSFIAYDVEDRSMLSNGKQLNTDISNRFLDFFKSKGYQTVIYTNPNWERNYIDIEQVKAHGHKVWLACYSNRTPDDTDYSADCAMWQWASDYQIEGFSGNLDVNICYDESLFKSNAPQPAPTPIPVPTPAPVPQPVVEQVDVTYCVRTNDGRWHTPVVNLGDYAGIQGKPIVDVAISVNIGSVKYRVHYKYGNRWSGYVTGYNIKDFNNGYAGNDRDIIDAVEVYYYTPNGMEVKRAKYRVSALNSDYYSWQYDNETDNGQDGYAGCFGNSIDRFQIIIE